MNNDLFQQARSAYVSKDYSAALNLFTECLQDASSELLPGEAGLLYHQIGNCLVKLGDPNEAIQAYSRAAGDVGYDAAGSVYYNLGMVYASQNDYEDASAYFQKAVDDPNYATPYKAYQGLGNSQLKLGKSAEAGAAFRSAALDQANPDPVKALLNLGICFMALDRPMDAIASYESALQFEMPAAQRNKIFANMGQAYVAAGKMSRAVRAFESALSDKTYVFNDAANVDYQRAVAAVAAGNADEPDEQPLPEADLSGLDVSTSGVLYSDASQQPDFALAEAQTTVMEPVSTQDSTFFDPIEGSGFPEWESGKKKRHRGLKVFVVMLVLVLVVAGAGIFAYTQGMGYPSKDEVVAQLFQDPENAEVYASSVDEAQRQHIQDLVVVEQSPQVLGQTNELNTAHVYVNVRTVEDADIPYDVTLVRDGIGWKVSNVALYFASQQG